MPQNRPEETIGDGIVWIDGDGPLEPLCSAIKISLGESLDRKPEADPNREGIQFSRSFKLLVSFLESPEVDKAGADSPVEKA